MRRRLVGDVRRVARLRIAEEQRADDVGGGGAFERRLPCEHLVEEHAEREQIGAGVEIAAARLFGRHVVERAHDDAVLGLDELRRSSLEAAERRAHQLGEPEVQDLHVAVGADHHVLGLEVAMDDAGVVRGRDRLRDLDGDVERLVDANGPAAASAAA